MTGNLVATFSRRTLLLASCSLSGVPERSYAQALAMIHIILLGDSVFDNAAYVDRNPDVVRQLGQMLPQGRKATLLARDGAVISEMGSQLRTTPLAGNTAKSAKSETFLDTYRTMCLAPQDNFRRVLEEVREMRLAA